MMAYTFYETDNRVRRYAEALAQRGDEVHAIVLRRGDQKRDDVLKGVRVHRIQDRRIDEKTAFSYLRKLALFLVRSAILVTREHLNHPYDLIHVHSVPDFQVFATLIPRLLGARIILDIHDIVPELYASKFKVDEQSYVFRLLLLIEKMSATYCHHVIIANHLWHRKLIQRAVATEKCTTIMNYPDPSIFSPAPRPDSGRQDIVMCYPGTLNHHQGVDLAVKAVSILREKVPQLKLLIVGDGPERDALMDLIAREELEGRISMTGFVPMERVAEIMATTDIGIVPKRAAGFGGEAFSTKTMEFMAMGVPVIVSRTPVDEYYFNDTVVHFFEPDDVDDLAAKILELIDNPSKRADLRHRAAEFVAGNNWDVRRGEYLSLVDRLAGEPARVAASVARSR